MNELPNTDQILIRKLTDIIHTNLGDENFGVNDLAQKSGMSLKSLRKRLDKISGKTVSQFIRDTRLHKAMEMLQNESYTVSEIAYRVGFASPIYFIKCFHEYFGFSPGKVKKGDLTASELINLPADLIGEKKAKSLWKSNLFTLQRILILAAFLGVTGYFLINKAYKSEKIEDLVSSDGRISIAVMPFQNLTEDTTWNIWQAGIQNEMINSLSNYKEIKLKQSEPISRLIKGQGVNDFVSLTPNIESRISRKLGASAFLFGRILAAGSRMRVVAQLTDTKTNEVFKSFQVEQPASEKFVFQIIDTLSTQISNFLVMTVLGKQLRPGDRPSTRSPEAYRFYENGLRAFLRRDFTAAIGFYREALARDSNLTVAASDMSYAYGYLGQEEQSRNWCLWLYKRKDKLSYYDKLWVDFVYANNFETPFATIKCLERLQEYDEKVQNYHYLLGGQYLVCGQFTRAVAEFRKSFDMTEKMGPELLDDWDYAGLGNAYHKAGMYKEEKKLYRKASRDFPESIELLYREAVLALSLKDSLTGGKYIGRYTTIMKNNGVSEADLWTNLARIYSEADSPGKAEQNYRLALSGEPHNPARINNLAYFLIDNDRNLKEGLSLADSALKFKPDSYNFLYTKGWGLYKMGKLQEALDILQKSWDLRMQQSYFDYHAFMQLEQVRKKLGLSPS